MSRHRILFAVLAIALVAGGWSLGDDPPPKYRGILPAGWKKLGLDDAQVQKIYKIQAEYRPKIEDLERRARELRTQERKEMLKVLTKAQRDRLRELRDIPEDTPAKDAPAKDAGKKEGGNKDKK